MPRSERAENGAGATLGAYFLSCAAWITCLPAHLSLLKLKELKPKAVLLFAMQVLVFVLMLLMLMLVMALQIFVVLTLMLVLVLPAVLTVMIFEYQDVALS